MYAGEVGIPRLLKLFAKYDIKTTWFIPGMPRQSLLSMYEKAHQHHARSGHSIETFPEQLAAVRDAGHEMYARPVPFSLR